MKLYYAPPSPFARKVRVLARELGLQEQIEEIVVQTTPLEPDARVAAANPIAKIPVLVTDDGTAVHDSAVICEYLIALASSKQLVPQLADGSRWAALTRLSLADGIMEAGLAHRYEVIFRPPALHWQPWLNAQRGKIRTGLAALAKNPPAVGQPLGLDAIGVACALGWLALRMPEIDWRTTHPELRAFQDAMLTRPSMVQTDPSL